MGFSASKSHEGSEGFLVYIIYKVRSLNQRHSPKISCSILEKIPHLYKSFVNKNFNGGPTQLRKGLTIENQDLFLNGPRFNFQWSKRSTLHSRALEKLA